MSLRKAAEMALEYFEDAYGVDVIEFEIKEALRQALAQPEQEPVGYVTIENISSWAQVPSIKWFKKPTEGPLYTAPPALAQPVDGVNMSQERVDETAKRKREWVGLTDEEIEGCKINGGLPHAINWRLSVKVMEAKLKEKNSV